MAQMSNEKKKALAERMYINDGESAIQIAATVGVTKNTIHRWIREGNWEERRKQILTAPHKIKEFLDGYMLKIIEQNEITDVDVKKADALVKVSAARDRLDDGINVYAVVSIFKEFNNFLTDVNTDFVVMLTEYQKMFIQYKGEAEL